MKRYIKPSTQVLSTELEMFLQTSGELKVTDDTSGGVIKGQFTKESLWDDALDSDW